MTQQTESPDMPDRFMERAIATLALALGMRLISLR
jgi:hypothetical protein